MDTRSAGACNDCLLATNVRASLPHANSNRGSRSVAPPHSALHASAHAAVVATLWGLVLCEAGFALEISLGVCGQLAGRPRYSRAGMWAQSARSWAGVRIGAESARSRR
jgi:hypothetical protein